MTTYGYGGTDARTGALWELLRVIFPFRRLRIRLCPPDPAPFIDLPSIEAVLPELLIAVYSGLFHTSFYVSSSHIPLRPSSSRA
jgi:hypothetical protein